MLCRQVEQMLSTEDHGKDLASVTNLLKKHQLMEADIAAHDVRIVQRCALCQPSCLISLHLSVFCQRCDLCQLACLISLHLFSFLPVLSP